MRREYYTTSDDAAFLRRRLSDARREWHVGDACLSYDLSAQTTVAAITGDIVTLANGDQLHLSKMRSIR